jgi:hypothetical protein
MNRPGAYLEAVGGHLIDLFHLLNFDVKNPHSLSKLRNIDKLRRRTGARVLIETGTYRGVTAARCARLFERVITIELDPKLHREAAAYLSRWPNVEPILGDCLAALPSILDRPDVQDVLVFLDGHFSGGVTAHGDVPEPAVLELDVLARYKAKLRGIVVDDFRCFGTEPGMPTKAELMHVLEKHFNAGYEIAVHLDEVLIARRKG